MSFLSMKIQPPTGVVNVQQTHGFGGQQLIRHRTLDIQPCQALQSLFRQDFICPDTWKSWNRDRNILQKNLYSQDPFQELITPLENLSPTIRGIFGDDRVAGSVFLPDYCGAHLKDAMMIMCNHFKPAHAMRQDPRLMALHRRQQDVLIESCLEFEVKTLSKIISFHTCCLLEDSRLWVFNHVVFMNVIVFGTYYSIYFLLSTFFFSHHIGFFLFKRYASVSLSQRL